MAFYDTKKNNGYHSLFIKLFGHVWGGAFFSEHGVNERYVRQTDRKISQNEAFSLVNCILRHVEWAAAYFDLALT